MRVPSVHLASTAIPFCSSIRGPQQGWAPSYWSNLIITELPASAEQALGYNRGQMDTIFIEALEFYGYHGLFDSEQDIGHRYVVDVELSTNTQTAGRSD